VNPIRFWFAIFTVLALVMVAPAWVYFAGEGLTGTPLVVDWLVAAMLPFTLMIAFTSWIQSWGSV